MPFRSEKVMSSTTAPLSFASRRIGPQCPVPYRTLSGPLHLAGRRKRRVLGAELDVGLEPQSRLLDIELDVVRPRRDEHRLENLVVVGSHLGFADGRVYFDAFERFGKLDRIVRFGLARGRGDHIERRLEAIVSELVVLPGEALLESGNIRVELGQRVVVIFADLLDDAEA